MIALLALACGGAPEHAGHEGHEGHEGHAMGPMAVEVAPEAVQALGIRTEPATRSEEAVQRRAPATVGWDPHAVTPLTAQAGGQIRELLLPLPGEPVKQWQVVARVYQPEVRAAFEELRVAKGLGEPWLGAARDRLVATDIARADVDAALASGQVPETYAVRSPIAGVVLDHPVQKGAWLAPGGVVGVVGDPAALVVDLVVSGTAPPSGSPVVLRDAATGESWPATISGPLPTNDAAGLRVRAIPQAAPPVGRPLVAEWSESAAGGVWVPSTAVVDTGERRVVFVEVGDGRYEPRPVTLGQASGERIQVLDGVQEGEPVVVSGTFLLDSESQIGAMGHAGHGG